MFIIGIDLGNEYSQVCYYNVAKSEPESVSFQSPAADLRVPTVVLREYNNTNGWMAGEVAVSCSRLGEGVLFDKLLDAAAAGHCGCCLPAGRQRCRAGFPVRGG